MGFFPLFGVLFYKSYVLRTNVLIALNKLIESKSTNGTLLPTQLVPQTPMCPGSLASPQEAQDPNCHVLYPNAYQISGYLTGFTGLQPLGLIHSAAVGCET